MKTTHYERGYIVNLVIKTKISLIILTLFFSVTSFAQIGNDKALFVDFFGLSIFNIDEDGAVVGPTAFERQDALFKYIDDHGITTIILKSLDGIEAGSAFLFPKTNATTYPVSGSGKEQVLANFLHECRYTHGVSHIAAGDTPSRSNGSINYFYDNIILFNAYSIANFTYNSGTEYGYFDMLYGETDYWGNSNDLTTPAGRAKIMTDWNNYIGLNGFQHIKSLQNSNPTIPVVGDDLLISTYLGNLNNVTAASPLVFPNTTVTQQNQVDLIDANVDWVFLAFYFQGSQMSPTKFFSVDGGVAGIGGNGKRLELFSKNDDPTVIIPLFGSSSANINGTGSDKNYFGDYLKYDNLTTGIFTPIGQSVLGTSGTLDDVKDLFEYYYNNTINPYGETTGPHLTKTMREICETDVVTPNEPNIMNKGVGWFKFSTMPDAKYFLKFNDDDVIGALNANTLTVSADDLITTGTAACTTSASTCKSLQNATSLFFDLKNYKWYYQGSTYPTLTSSFTFNPVSTAISYLTAEFEVTAYEEPGFVTPVTGTFDHIKIRKTFKVDPFLVGSSTDHFNISTFTAPSCPSFDNGSISIEWSPTPNTGYQYYLYGYFKSTNTTSTPDAIGSSCNGYTVTDLTADTYTVKLYTGICYGSGNSITYSALTPVFTSGPSPQIISTTFILNNSSTIPEPQIITSELNEINCNPDLTATSISGATYEWKDINGQVVSSVQNFTASENGTYTVTVTDAQGCVGTSAPYVLKMKPTPTIEGSDITCETNKTYTVTADLNNPTYNWTIPGTVIAIEVANSITITDWDIYENTGATISCEVTNGCGESATAYFTVNGCCSPTTGVTDINNYTLSSSASMNGTYHVNGILAVTSGTLTLDGADMTFGDEAKILVATGCTLNIVNSTHLYACDPNIRWQGIVLEDRAVLLIDGAMIENAISAVTCNGSEVEYSISTALFNNNNAGIQINGDGTSTVFDGTVTNSVFTARNISFSNVPALINTLKGTNNSTNIDSYSKLDTRCNVGIDVLNVGTTSTAPVYNLKIGEAGTFSSKGNIFDNCNYGVRTNQSNVEIVNNLFQQMEGGLAFGKKTIGIAIFGSNGINTTNQYCLKIGGSNTNEKNTILDCGIGILAVEYTHALIAKNDISKTAGIGSYSASNYTGRLGIKLVNKHRSNFDCNNNTLSNIYYGIEWSQNLSNDVEGNFNSNTIGTSSTGEDCYTAINLNGVGNFIDRSCEIEVNGNTINGVLNGIKVANFKNADKINIKNNPYISLRNAQNSQYGILVTGTTNNNISDNVDIHSSGSSNKNITGIFVNNSLFSSINCNNISNIGTCVGFGGDCQNIINEGVLHRNNFSYYSTAVQILPLALLGTQGSSNNACDDEWNHTGLTSSSQDIINFSNPLDFKVRSTSLPYKPTFLLGNAIGFPLGSNSTVTCSGDPIKGSPLLPAEEKLRLTKLAINDIDYPVLAAENKWFYTQMAYEKLRVDTTLAIGDSILVAFRDSLEFGNIGKFYSVEQSIESGNWSTAETNNLAITFENHIEENLKKVNSYIIAYRADTTLGEDTTWVEDMIDNLVPIASECYTIGGPAVLSAKSMLSYFSNELFEESEDCFRALADSIVADSSNTLCGLFKSYYVPETEGATYTWTVPSGTSYIQSGNNISVNWGTIITSGGTITCLITDTLGNSSYSIYNQDALITAPTCVTVTANNTSCVTNSYLSWSAPSECAAGYYLMFGTNGGGSSDPNNITDTLDIGNVTTYSLPPYLLPNTIHYYKVIPYNNIHAPVSGCSIGSFTSGSSVAFTPTLGNPYIETFNGVTAPALPCGISVSNENFPQDNFKWETNSISSCSGNNSLTIAKNSNNTTAKNDWFYSHPLNLTAGELYRISYKSKAESSFTENLETYVAQSPDAATMLTTSTIINNSITSTNCISDSGDFIAPTSTVYYLGGHANSAAGQGTLYIDDLKVSLIKTTHLTTASCGDSLYTCDTLHCISYTGATSYKFRFENLNVSFSQDYTVTTANPKVYQFLGSNPLMLGQSYSVTVSAFVGGVWTPFGSACDVYVRPVPIRGLTGASCGGTLTDLSQLIYTNTTGICLINDYKYEFTDQSNNTVIETQRNSAVTSFLMTYITSPYVKYSTTYSVKVKLKIGSTWGEYGSACNVTTPASPLTKLANSYCDYTLPTFATPVNCVSVLGAQDYRYNIVGPNNYNRTFTRNSSLNNWYFTWTNSSPYMQANTTYDVKVASRAGGVWSDYGDVCTITTPATLSRMADTTFLQQVLQPIFDMFENSLELSVFPNPISQEHVLSIELKGITEHNQKAEIFIYNTLGERIYQSVTITKEENRLILMPEIKLSAGVYWVEANINNKKLHKRFVVQ